MTESGSSTGSEDIERLGAGIASVSISTRWAPQHPAQSRKKLEHIFLLSPLLWDPVRQTTGEAERAREPLVPTWPAGEDAVAGDSRRAL